MPLSLRTKNLVHNSQENNDNVALSKTLSNLATREHDYDDSLNHTGFRKRQKKNASLPKNHDGCIQHYDVHSDQEQDRPRPIQAVRSCMAFSVGTPIQFVESEKDDEDQFYPAL